MRNAIGEPDAVPAFRRATQVEAVEMRELDCGTSRVGYTRRATA